MLYVVTITWADVVDKCYAINLHFTEKQYVCNIFYYVSPLINLTNYYLTGTAGNS